MAIRLRPRNPSMHQVGNAILYGGERKIYVIKPDETVEAELFYVETDFGNHMKLTWREVEEMFTVAGWQDYGTWREARAECRNQIPLNQREEWPDADPAAYHHLFEQHHQNREQI